MNPNSKNCYQEIDHSAETEAAEYNVQAPRQKNNKLPIDRQEEIQLDISDEEVEENINNIDKLTKIEVKQHERKRKKKFEVPVFRILMILTAICIGWMIFQATNEQSVLMVTPKIEQQQQQKQIAKSEPSSKQNLLLPPKQPQKSQQSQKIQITQQKQHEKQLEQPEQQFIPKLIDIDLIGYTGQLVKQTNLKLFKHQQIMNPAIQQELNQILQGTFYDVHYFVEDDENCQHRKGMLLHLASENVDQNTRQFIQITKTNEQLEQLIQKMKFNKDRPKTFPKIKGVTRVSAQSINTAYFFQALNSEPENPEYLQAEFYRYHKLYKIGDYGTQLPLCISLVGKNTQKYMDKLYTSIQRQNYTNYRIVHIDDNSNDGTSQKISQIIQQKPKLKNKVTFLTQKIRRNQLFNRNLGIRKYCQDDAIILDMDADDWIIGNQVFQLVNTIYQTGNMHENVKQDLWSLYFGPLIYSQHCKCYLPNVDGQIDPKYFSQHTYRAFGKWRTTHLRTFRKKLYQKIDIKEFIDRETGKNYLFSEAPDSFMHTAILELSGPKHLKVLDEFLYFYTTTIQNNLRRDHSVDIFYSAYSSQALVPYEQLQSLQDSPEKMQNYATPEISLRNKQEKTAQIRTRRMRIVQQIQQLLQRSRGRDRNYG